MPVKIGFIDDITATNLKSFQDVVRINVEDDSRLETDRSGFGDLFGVRHSAKAEIDVEFDRLSQTNLGTLRKVLHNQSFPHKVFLNHPADTKQLITFSGITNPSSTHIIKKVNTSDANFPPSALPFGTSTEISTADYTTASAFGSNIISSGTAEYSYFFIQFDLNAGGAGYLSSFTVEDIQRLTLFFNNIQVTQVSDSIGYKVDVFKISGNSWVEIKRQGLTSTTDFQQTAGLRLVDGFTSFSDFISGSNKLTFRVRNLTANTNPSVDAMDVAVGVPILLINGFGALHSNSDNFTFRDTFTGAGYTGSLRFSEL